MSGGKILELVVDLGISSDWVLWLKPNWNSGQNNDIFNLGHLAENTILPTGE